MNEINEKVKILLDRKKILKCGFGEAKKKIISFFSTRNVEHKEFFTSSIII